MNKNFPLTSLFFFMSFVMLLSSQNWFSLWMSMELNTFSFLTLMMSTRLMKKDHLILFFSVQTLSSFLLLSSLLLTETKFLTANSVTMTLTLAMAMKMGLVPLHNWSVPVAVMNTPLVMMIFLTAQKIFPFLFLKMFNNPLSFIFFFSFWMSIMWGAMQNLNQKLMKNIIIYSSISHLGWLLISLFKISTWEYYFLFYCMISFVLYFFLEKSMKQSNTSKNNMLFFLVFMSLGGLPPLLGFFPKLNIMENSLKMSLFLLLSVMVLLSILDLYVYARISVLSTMMIKNSLLWKKKEMWPLNMFLSITVMFILLVMT